MAAARFPSEARFPRRLPLLALPAAPAVSETPAAADDPYVSLRGGINDPRLKTIAFARLKKFLLADCTLSAEDRQTLFYCSTKVIVCTHPRAPIKCRRTHPRRCLVTVLAPSRCLPCAHAFLAIPPRPQTALVRFASEREISLEPALRESYAVKSERRHVETPPPTSLPPPVAAGDGSPAVRMAVKTAPLIKAQVQVPVGLMTGAQFKAMAPSGPVLLTVPHGVSGGQLMAVQLPAMAPDDLTWRSRSAMAAAKSLMAHTVDASGIRSSSPEGATMQAVPEEESAPTAAETPAATTRQVACEGSPTAAEMRADTMVQPGDGGPDLEPHGVDGVPDGAPEDFKPRAPRGDGDNAGSSERELVERATPPRRAVMMGQLERAAALRRAEMMSATPEEDEAPSDIEEEIPMDPRLEVVPYAQLKRFLLAGSSRALSDDERQMVKWNMTDKVRLLPQGAHILARIADSAFPRRLRARTCACRPPRRACARSHAPPSPAPPLLPPHRRRS